jgi:hypothetical protein
MEAGRITRELLERGSLQIPGGGGAAVGEAAAVCDVSGAFHSWVVPLTIKEKLVAWAQFSARLELQRFSTFLRREGEFDPCPDVADWFDPEVVRKRVIDKVGEEVDLSVPMLTFDRDPSRLVWLVEALRARGEPQRWFVAGPSVWEDPGMEDVTGGPGR